jgi:hypothetical protein
MQNLSELTRRLVEAQVEFVLIEHLPFSSVLIRVHTWSIALVQILNFGI